MRPPLALISSTAILTPLAISLPSGAIAPPTGKRPTTLPAPPDPPPPAPPPADDLGAIATPARPPTTSPPTAAAPPTSRDRRVTSRRVNESLATYFLLVGTRNAG